MARKLGLALLGLLLAFSVSIDAQTIAPCENSHIRVSTVRTLGAYTALRRHSKSFLGPNGRKSQMTSLVFLFSLSVHLTNPPLACLPFLQ